MSIPSVKTLKFIFYIESSQNLKREYIIFNDDNNKVFFLSDFIQDSDSNSTAIAGARILITYLFSYLQSSHLIGDDKLNPHLDSENKFQKELSNNWVTLWKHENYYELQDFLCDQIIYNSDDNIDFLYLIRLNKNGLNNLSKLKQYQFFSSDYIFQKQIVNINLDNYLNQVHEFENLKSRNTYIQFINKPAGWDKYKKGRPFVPVDSLYKGLFKKKFEKWYTYNVAKGEYPPDYILQQSKAIIIPGSGAGAWEDVEWVVNLRNFIKETYANYSNLKFVGICFGFQILAQSLGGSVQQLEERKKDPHYHIIGNEKIICEQDLFQEQFAKGIFENTSELYINKGHGDYVRKIPDIFINMGRSDITFNEIALSKDKRILCFQGHPEYSFEWSKRLMATFSFAWDKDHDENWHIQSEAFKQLFAHPNDHKKLCLVIENFIKQ